MAVGGLFLAAVLILSACGDDDDNDVSDVIEVSAEFTGDGCVYSGPTEFEVGDELEIRAIDVTEERMDVGYAVTKVPDGTSVAEVQEKGLSEVVPEDSDGEFVFSLVTEEGTERVLSVTLDEAGTWLIHCFAMNPDGAFPATTFEVVEES